MYSHIFSSEKFLKSLNKNSLHDAACYLAEKDKDLARLFSTEGTPPLWSRKPGFTTLIRIILEQQVSLASGKAMFKKLEKNITPFSAERFVELGIDYLKSLGVTRQKSAYCLNVANAIFEDSLDFRKLSMLDDKDAKEMLMKIKGIGSWTADIYLLMALRRPDVFPSGDIALVNTIKIIKRLRKQLSEEKILKIAGKWKPYRSVAARMLWQHYLSGNLNKKMLPG